MSKLKQILVAVAALSVAGAALAAGADLGQAAKQQTNWTAIAMFGIFVGVTLYITKWAAGKTKTAADFYTAGGGIVRLIWVGKCGGVWGRSVRQLAMGDLTET